MLSEDELVEKRWVINSRVSSDGQKDGPSLSEQERQVTRALERLDGVVVDTISNAESATTLDRDSIDKIVRLAENDDYDILGIATLDRLTRADPWEAIDFLRTLYEAEIIIWAGDYGGYDWDDLNDFRKLMMDIAFSREIIEKIMTGQLRGFRSRLQNREWPFSHRAPAGFKLDEDDDRKLYLCEGAETVVPRIFEKYAVTESILETTKIINEEVLPVGEIERFSESQIGAILENEMFLGELSYDGTVFLKVDEFAIVAPEIFDRAAAIRSLNSTSNSSKDPIEKHLESLEHLESHAKRFGTHYPFLHILKRFLPMCGECGGVLEWDESSTGQALGLPVPRFECENCGEERNIPDTDELKAMHQVLPLRCPYCVGTDEFSVRLNRQPGGEFDYIYECKLCEHEWGSNFSPNKLKRSLDHPDLGVSLNDETPDSYQPPDDDSQRELGDYEEDVGDGGAED